MNIYTHAQTHHLHTLTQVQIHHLTHMYTHTHTGREVRSTTKYKQTQMQQKVNRQMDAGTKSDHPEREEPCSALFSYLYISFKERNTGWDERMNG